MDAKVRACLKNNSQKGYILKRITVIRDKGEFPNTMVDLGAPKKNRKKEVKIV